MHNLGRVFSRVDKTCGDLNVILVVFAIGLAILDMTVFFTNVIMRNAHVERHRLEQVTNKTATEIFPAQTYY